VSSDGIIRPRHHACAVAPIHGESSNARKFPTRRAIVAISVLCSTFQFASAIAQTQQLTHAYVTLNRSTSANGWWSPQESGTTIAPYLQFSMADGANTDSYRLSRTFRGQKTSIREIDACENEVALGGGNHPTKARPSCPLSSDLYGPNHQSDMKVRGSNPRVKEQRVQVSLYPLGGQSGFFLGDSRSSPLGLFLYPETWPELSEQHISNTAFFTDEKGVPVYPVIEGNLASSRFSITLYTPPLRGSLRTAR
jgi:hypothetical protein